MHQPAGYHIAPVKTVADVAAIADLFRDYAASVDVDLAYQSFDAELAALPGKYEPPSGALLLARAPDGKPVGCVALRPMHSVGCCEIKRLYVSPAGRGLGLGRGLVEAIVKEARRIGYREMRLDTLPSMTDAIALYRKFGFATIAPYYDSPVPGTIYLGLTLDRD